MSTRNSIQLAFDQFCKESGLKKRSGSWYGQTDEVISITDLQKSQYGPSYYINQGFCLIELAGETHFPRWNQAHIVARLERLIPGAVGQRLTTYLDFERLTISDEERSQAIIEILEDHLLPVLKEGSSIEGLRQMATGGMFRAAGVRGPAQELLGISHA